MRHLGVFACIGCVSGMIAGALGPPLGAQEVAPSPLPGSHILVPQSRALGLGRAVGVRVSEVEAGVVIVAQVATTTLDIRLENPTRSRLEAELLMPVPDGAVVRAFAFEGSASEPTARLLPKDEARSVYESIVARVRDPALLEFAGYNLVRSSVFPVEAGGGQRIRLTYEHVLAADGSRVDYVLPRSESLELDVPWKVAVRVRAERAISTVYSPSHAIETVRSADETVSVRLAAGAGAQPGPFRMSYLLEDGDVTASLLAYPGGDGEGYFLLLAGLPPRPAAGESPVRREVTLVIDRSGSMRGGKIDQAREAARQVIAGLEDGESFNIIAYDSAVEPFSAAPVVKSRESVARADAFLSGLRASSGTNIHDALIEALRQEPAEGALPLVLFLTDGLPTVGQTSERAIREVATASNPHGRRIFAFGVGHDVNTPLLERIAVDTRGAATFVHPGEDVEVKVGSVFRKLRGPILAGPRLESIGPSGEPVAGRVREVLPGLLPDLFEGDQLVVLGRYRDGDDLRFRLAGSYLGAHRAFELRFGLDGATTRHAFVPRLWASRKVAVLVDAVRALGADAPASPALPSAAEAARDPRLAELVGEILRISTEFGVLTEYTAFLAREGTDLADADRVIAEATRNFIDRAVHCRTGIASVNQEGNLAEQRSRQWLNARNSYVDASLERVAISSVQQVCDRTFYRRGGRWIDGRLASDAEAGPARSIELGSPEYLALVRRLADEGRQATVSLRGDILLLVDGERVLVKAPAAADEPAATTEAAEPAEPANAPPGAAEPDAGAPSGARAGAALDAAARDALLRMGGPELLERRVAGRR